MRAGTCVNPVAPRLRRAHASAQLPHLLFYGPPGTGKTSTVLALARQLFGEHRKERVLELNASDERGIQVVREKVKLFAQAAISRRPGIPPFKLVILDEADSMTADAQSALRRTMEAYSRVTRFCLLCNYVSRCVPRCAHRRARAHSPPTRPPQHHRAGGVSLRQVSVQAAGAAVHAGVPAQGGRGGGGADRRQRRVHHPSRVGWGHACRHHHAAELPPDVRRRRGRGRRHGSGRGAAPRLSAACCRSSRAPVRARWSPTTPSTPWCTPLFAATWKRPTASSASWCWTGMLCRRR